MTIGDILDWSIEFGPVDAEIKCRPMDAKMLVNAMLPDSFAILAVDDAGVWVRSRTYRQGTHTHCPAEAFPEFECSTAGAVAVYPSHLSTLRFATLSTDPERVSVSLHGDRLSMEASAFGGTVPTVIPDDGTNEYQEIANFDLRAIHDSHTAGAQVVDWKFDDFLDRNADLSDSELTFSPDEARITTPDRDAQWCWEESTGSGEATYRGQEVLEVFEQLSQLEKTPRFTWTNDEPVAMIFRRDQWLSVGYVIPAQNSSADRADSL